MPENFEATIEKLVYGGDGLARVDGRVVLAPYVLPGERVLLSVVNEKPGLVRAGKPRAILTPSEHRTTPRCAHFTWCGGCDYQHASYEYQLDQKVEILREVFARVGKFDLGKVDYQGDIAIIAGPEWGYRNRIQLHFLDGKLGFHAPGTHKVAEIRECPVSSPKLNEAIVAMRDMVGDRRWPDFLRSMELFSNETNVQVNVIESGGKRLARPFFDWIAERIPGADATALEYETVNATYRVSHKAFFQTNRYLVDSLAKEVTAGREGKSAWDLYAGVGLFSLPLATRFEEVTAVESSAAASGDLTFNAERAGRAITVFHSGVEQFLAAKEDGEAPDFVLADPPRAGLGKAVVDHLARLKPARITIVSCDPATLARDLAGLLAQGYAIDRLTLADLFPHTAHLETIVHLRQA
jgi:23S rRNA (uracil1939-C5)-methyltransferase